MQHIRTLIQDRISEDVVFTIEDVILPAEKGEGIYLNGKRYAVYQVTLHLNYLDTGGQQITETIWI